MFAREQLFVLILLLNGVPALDVAGYTCFQFGDSASYCPPTDLEDEFCCLYQGQVRCGRCDEHMGTELRPLGWQDKRDSHNNLILISTTNSTKKNTPILITPWHDEDNITTMMPAEFLDSYIQELTSVEPSSTDTTTVYSTVSPSNIESIAHGETNSDFHGDRRARRNVGTENIYAILFYSLLTIVVVTIIIVTVILCVRKRRAPNPPILANKEFEYAVERENNQNYSKLNDGYNTYASVGSQVELPANYEIQSDRLPTPSVDHCNYALQNDSLQTQEVDICNYEIQNYQLATPHIYYGAQIERLQTPPIDHCNYAQQNDSLPIPQVAHTYLGVDNEQTPNHEGDLPNYDLQNKEQPAHEVDFSNSGSQNDQLPTNKVDHSYYGVRDKQLPIPPEDHCNYGLQTDPLPSYAEVLKVINMNNPDHIFSV